MSPVCVWPHTLFYAFLQLQGHRPPLHSKLSLGLRSGEQRTLITPPSSIILFSWLAGVLPYAGETSLTSLAGSLGGICPLASPEYVHSQSLMLQTKLSLMLLYINI